MVHKRWNKWIAYWCEKGTVKYKSFYSEQEAINCENEMRALNKLRKEKEKERKKLQREKERDERKLQRESRTKEQIRAEGLLKYGGTNECESEAIRLLVKLLENEWNIVLIRDGAHNDIALQKKDSQDTDLYYGIQIKSCSKQTANGTAKTPKAKFSKINHYPNSLLICICLKPLKIWFFHGSDLLNNKRTLVECKKPYFKEALCYDKEEGINKLQDFLTTYLKNYEEHKLDYYDLQIGTSQFLEDYANRLYKVHKKLPIVSERRGLNEIENSCVDCIDPDCSRIQEKVCCVKTGRTGFEVALNKNNGMDIEGKDTKRPYNENDFDKLRVYLFCKVDELGKVSFKRECYNIKYNGKNYEQAIEDIKSYKLFGYFDIPMNHLIFTNYVSTKNQKGKTSLTVYLPQIISNIIHHRLPNRNCSSFWTTDYFNLVYSLEVDFVNNG